MLQFNRENGWFPAGIFCQLIISKNIGSNLIFSEVLQPDGGNFFHPSKLGRFHTAVTGNDSTVRINQYWVGEAKYANTFGYLPYLVLRMGI